MSGLFIKLIGASGISSIPSPVPGSEIYESP